jgi:hypothetical protein
MEYQTQWQEWLNEAYELLEKLKKYERFKGWRLEVRIFGELKPRILVEEVFRKGKEKVIIFDRCFLENGNLAFYPESIYISKDDKLVPITNIDLL